MNLSVLIHTFNGYQHLWNGCIEAFRKHWNVDGVQMCFGTDLPCDYGSVEPFDVYYSGDGNWSDRLISLMADIRTDYVLYIQEDHWLFRSPPNLSEMMQIVSERQLLRLQLSPVNRFYTLEGTDIPLFFDPSSKYLVSHQPSIWRKDFLLSCLEPNETPWENEYKGTLRLNNREEYRRKIAIYPCDWFKHMCSKGKLIE